jgi:GT2 family glycosyltransferase
MISICICTYNRREHLRHALDCLAVQPSIQADAEVLIIDNNCTDGTAHLVDEFRERLPIRRIVERQQGLSYARNRAAAEFRGDFLLFTDDDVRVTSGWLSSYRSAIRRFTGADYFCGRVLPEWAGNRPEWIGDRPLPLIDGVLVWFDLGVQNQTLSRNEPAPFGASFGIRRTLFEKIGVFRTDLGAGGTSVGRGEETEFVMRAKSIGAQGVYVGEALSFHAFEPSRLKLSALYRYGIASGKSYNSIGIHQHRGSYVGAGWFIMKGIYQLLKGHRERFAQCVINAGIEVGATATSRAELDKSV